VIDLPDDLLSDAWLWKPNLPLRVQRMISAAMERVLNGLPPTKVYPPTYEAFQRWIKR